ncbi:hypothetical protein TWF696_009379 [Orbilia brochopaga]|uniref:Ell binding protein Ebp1 C-terminal domain-containing protein n=1 Tax=Orbilia brochopaga TaxID=3140254 RepID=A0AAV9UFY9_9PEZI
MAHATTASASSQTHVNVDARLKNLKKNVLPDYPLRLTQVNDHTDARKPSGNCKYCGQNKDNCFCYAHHTFLSREEMTTYSDKTSGSDQVPPSSRLLSSQHTPIAASQSFSAAASRSGKKMSLGEYSKRMQEGGSGAGRSTPKDAPSPAEATISRDTPSTKSKAQQSNSLSAAESTTGLNDGDRPAKKLKTSSSTSVPIQNTPVSRLTNNISTSSKNIPLSRSPSKKSTASEENPTSTDRKPSVARLQASKRDASSSRPKSPSASSKSDYSRNRRSQSPIERPRERPQKKDDRDHKTKSERLHSKDHDRMGPLLPKMLSPLPDELNRLVDEYERKHPELIKYRDVDSLSMDDEPPRKHKRGDKPTDKSSHSESRMGNKPDGDSRPSKSEHRLDRLDPGGRDADGRVQLQGQSPRQGFKVPAKRPPADAVPKSRDPERDPSRLVVRLHYGSRNVNRVKKILKSEPKSVVGKDDGHPSEQQSERTAPRERSPHLPTRVSMTTLKATPSVRSSSNGKIATPNRRMASSSERPKSSEQGQPSRLSTSQSNDREPDELGDNDMLRADSEAFLALGIKLKHKADEALGVKNPEEANLHHAMVYACHCVIAYFLSFGLDDELRRRENRSSTSESWKGVVGYIKFLLSSRLKANPTIHGLLYQMGAICSERVSSFEQERLLGISLSESAQPEDNNNRNVLENVRRSRNDLVRILRTNHEWWNLGHQRLPWATVQAEFQRTWSKRSPQVIRKPQITPGHYLTPFYLPLYSGSTAFEAATFAWMVTQEWAAQARLSLDTGLHLTWSSRDDREG